MTRKEEDAIRKRHSDKHGASVSAYIAARQHWGDAWDRLGLAFQRAIVGEHACYALRHFADYAGPSGDVPARSMLAVIDGAFTIHAEEDTRNGS